MYCLSKFGLCCQLLVVTDDSQGGVPSASNIRLVSFNCNSIGKNPKRNKVFHFLNKHRPDILIVCDTRIAKNIENTIKEKWGGPSYFSSFDSQSRGVAIFLKKNLPIMILDTCSDEQGNLLGILAEFDSKIILLHGVYDPNTDRTDFYKSQV